MVDPFWNVEAVAFDLDDTLFDREEALHSLLNTWMQPGPGLWEEILARDGGGHSSREAFFGWLASERPGLGCTGSALWQRFNAEFPGHIRPDPNALELVEKLNSTGRKVAVLTNGGADFQAAKFKAAGFAGLIRPERLLISSSIGVEKPRSGAFAAIGRATGVPASRTLFIGDHPVVDVAGAKRAGLRTCWLVRRRNPGYSAAADLVIDSMADLVPFVAELP